MTVGERRWGWSALSKENNTLSYSEEVMIDKYTGEILIKTPDENNTGDIISYDSIARTKAHIDTVTATAQSRNLYGKIYILEDTNIGNLPKVLSNDTTALVGLDPIIIMDQPVNKFMLSLDIDTLLINPSEITRERIDPVISMTIEYGDNDNTITDTFSDKLSVFNQKVFTNPIYNPEALGFYTNIRSLEVSIDRTNIGQAPVFRHILNSIIFVRI